MAKSTKNTAAATPPTERAPKASKRYFIVNPAGAVHEVTRAAAADRLKQPGYRMATAEEVAALDAANGFQQFDRPIGKPYSTDPDEGEEEAAAAEA